VLEQLGVDLCERQVAERGPDVLLDLAEVSGPRGEVELDDLQPTVEQLRERGGGPGLPALVDLAQQLDPHALRLGPRLGGLLQGVPKSRDFAAPPELPGAMVVSGLRQLAPVVIAAD
jgi:hypothetical protein